MSLFVDTSALIAFLDEDEGNHERAVATFDELLRNVELVTHNYVVLEATALVHSRWGTRASRDLLRGVVRSLNVAWVDVDLHDAAVAAFLAANRRDASLVDWTSFEFMHRRGLATAFAFDRDFGEQGFETIPAER